MHAAVKRKLVRDREEELSRFSTTWIKVAFAGVTFLAMLGAAGVGTLFLAYRHYAEGYVPIEQKIEQRWTGLTEVYDRNGELLGTLSNPHGQLAQPVHLDEISHWMSDATVSTEDNTFWENPGVNPAGILRAAKENYAGGGVGSGTGGSSITQQLIKNVYLTTDCHEEDGARVCVAPRTLERKLKEIAYAFELERDTSKAQILEYYLNSISYADRYVGVQAAAEGYFHVAAKDLSLAQAATLAGIPAAPTDYHPRLNCVKNADGVCTTDEQGRTQLGGKAKERQEEVLDLMVEHGKATADEVAAAKAETIWVYPQTSSMKAAAWIDSQVEPRLVRMCEAGMLPKIEGADSCEDSVHSGGYRVTSTLDWTATQQATALMNEWVAAGLKAGCNCHNAAISTIDPTTGQIMVYAPNIDPTWTSDPKVAGQIDQLTEINQPGSSFKPAVYLAYMYKFNKVPLSTIWDTSPLIFKDPNAVQSSVTILNPRPGNIGEGLITIRSALGGSQNVPAFRAAQETGIDSVIGMAKALGITTLDVGFDPTFRDHKAIYYGPSIATGGANVRAIDMAYMNATIANMGYMVGVPTLAKDLDMAHLLDFDHANDDAAIAKVNEQRVAFQHGNLRLPGTRKLDPVVVLKVESADGKVLYEHGADLQKVAVMDPEAVWLLHSIMTDCTARWIIWSCGKNNDDLSLDAYMGDIKLPTGIKTGTQQGANATDTLATWMNGFTRNAAVSVWVGNSDKSLVRDGPTGNYASANTTVRLFKHWMETYHLHLKELGVEIPLNWDDLRPADVVWKGYQTATTEHGARGGCSQVIEGWQRTDVEYKGDCQGTGAVPLPPYETEQAVAIAYAKGIPIRGFAGRPSVVSVAPTPTPDATAPAPAATVTQQAASAAPTPVPATPTATTPPTSAPPTRTPAPPTPTSAPPTPTSAPATTVPTAAVTPSASSTQANGN